MARLAWLVPVSFVALVAAGCDRTVTTAHSKSQLGSGGGNAGGSSSTSGGQPGDSCSTLGATTPCAGNEVSTCFMITGADTPPNEYAWSQCAVPACTKGQTETCPDGFTQVACSMNDIGIWGFMGCPSSSASTPLVLSFDSAPVVFSNAEGAFGLDPTKCVATDWPSAATPWLVLDRNGDGRIEDGGELFGSATMLQDGSYAKNGFQALAELDANHDGVISAADPAFDRLAIWIDKNQDRQSDPSELVSLRSLGVESISLHYGIAPRCDARHNCEIESARFVYRTSLGVREEGRVVDVHLAHH